jgi:ferredoxin
VPAPAWSDHLVPADDVVDASERDPEHVPSLRMVDADNGLRTVLVDESVIREARRCGAMWTSLQELGGVHNSHVDAALVEAEAHFALTLKEALANAEPVLVKETVVVSEAPDGSGDATVEEVILEVVETRNPDEAYIETVRCSTCNECTQINGKMFNYNENQQAFIADITAGTYAQLVEAAESCQVSVIHPGKPIDPSEPGLDDLLKRAEPFL